MIAGLAMALLAVSAPGTQWSIYVVIVMALVPLVYSFFAYRRVEGFAPDPDIDEDRLD